MLSRSLSKGMAAIVASIIVATVTVTTASNAGAQSGLPTPGVPLFGAVLDAYAPAQFQSTCDPRVRAGTDAFRRMVLQTYPQTGDLGMIRACTSGGTSEHKEGRAWDWRVNAFNATEKAIADTFLSWLLSSNEFGGPHAMARRYGLMYIIWNGRIFRLYDPGSGWRTYTGASPHTDHVHFSFSWDGALRRTTGFHHERTQPSACRSKGDFDPSGRVADPSVFRRSNGRWYVAGRTPGSGVPFGNPNSDIPCAIDYGTPDGVDDFTVFRPSNGYWFVRAYAPSGISYGQEGDIPVAADYNGNGAGDLAVYRPSNGRWYIRGVANSGIPYGVYGDIPVPSNYDGNPGDEIAVYRPAEARWYIRGMADSGIVYGQPGDIPVPAGYRGRRDDQIAVFRPTNGTWYVRGLYNSGIRFGVFGDVPVPADYNGNGRADLAVFRPSNGRWYIDLTRNGIADVNAAWGVMGDIPIPRRASL